MSPNPIRQLHFIHKFSNNCFSFIRKYLGVRDHDAPPLDPSVMRQLGKLLTLYIMLITIIIVALGTLYCQAWKAVGQAFDLGTPIPSMAALCDVWWWMNAAAMVLAMFSFAAAIWAFRLRSRFTIQYIFPMAALLLVCCCVAFKPMSRAIGQARLTLLYKAGVTLFNTRTWDDCYAYFHRFLYVFPHSPWSDNALGRMAGAKYWQGEHITALSIYADVLQRYPDSDVVPNIQRSLLWTMRKVGNEYSAEMCLAIFHRYGLDKLKFSPFSFFLKEPLRGESVAPNLFDSVRNLDQDGETRRSKIEYFLEKFPADTWAARAAFFIGNDKILANFPDSDYAKSAKVVQGWWLQRSQQYAAAAEQYEMFLATRPPEVEAEKVRQLLAKCYFSGTNLEVALEKLSVTESNKIRLPADEYYLLLESFAYKEHWEDLQYIYDKWCKQIPIGLARDLSWIAIERMKLEGQLQPIQLAMAYSNMRRLPHLASTPKANEWYSSIGMFVEAEFYFGDDLVNFINSRLKGAASDVGWRHYFDRNYGHDSGPWIHSNIFNYTALLHRYATNEFGKRLSQFTNFHAKIGYLTNCYDRIREPSLLNSPARFSLAADINAGVVAADADFNSLQELRKTELKDLVDALARLKVNALPLDAKGLRQAFDWVGAFPSDTNTAHLTSRLDDFLASEPIDNSLRKADLMWEALRKCNYRGKLFRVVAQRISAQLVKNGENSFLKARERNCALVLEGLKSTENYSVTQGIITNWLFKWPKDDLGDNLRMWQAWLLCWQANKVRDDRTAYLEIYRKALQIYSSIGRNCWQERVKLMALDSARQIRRKVKLIETGVLMPDNTKIPNDFNQ